ncbi:cardiolipin synthetase [Vibrio sp. JCM 19236]|nr:cardiolipin synthetase [Vibrio sp. JCM 19236]
MDLQYYIYRNDETGKLMTWRLFEAAERGVRVRILLDDMQKRNDQGLALLNSHPNIHIRLFNPNNYRTARNLGFLKEFGRLNSRMHNKSITADNVSSIVGGRNIGNEYFSYDTSVEFGDFDLLLYGNTVEQVADQFDQYWNSDFAVPVEWIFETDEVITAEDVKQTVLTERLEEQFTTGAYDITKLDLHRKLVNNQLPLYWGEGKLLYDLPDKVGTQNSQLIDDLTLILEDVEDNVVIISPYFVPTELGTQHLVEAVQSGKQVTIITNSLASNDVFAVHGWYAKYREDLIEGGVKLWEIKSTAKFKSKWSMTGSGRSSLHAKVMFFDDRYLFVGSMNWDPRSALHNTEMAVIIDQADFVLENEIELFNELDKYAYKLKIRDGDLVWVDNMTQEVFESEPDASIWLRMGAWMAGILPIEEQL